MSPDRTGAFSVVKLLGHVQSMVGLPEIQSASVNDSNKSDGPLLDKYVVSLSSDQLQHIGVLAVEMAWLDFAVEILIWSLVDYRGPLEDPGPALTWRMNTPTKVRTLGALAARFVDVESPLYIRLRKFSKDIEVQARARNNLIHAGLLAYRFEENADPQLMSVVQYVSAKRGYEPKVSDLEVQDIIDSILNARKLKNECIDLVKIFRNLADEMRSASPPKYQK